MDYTIEQLLSLLEESAEKLRSGDLSLDDSIKCYRSSIEYYNKASKMLKEARQKIEIYRPENGQTEEFDEY